MTDEPKPKHPGGRPPHQPTDLTRQTVRLHAMVGTPHEAISGILGICLNTLKTHYADELTQSRDIANANVGGALYNKAMSGDTASMIFWLKTRARWKETVDISNDDGSFRHRQEEAVLAYLAAKHANTSDD